MLVQQYDSTAGAGRPTPQHPSIGCGLPGPCGGYIYGKTRLLLLLVVTWLSCLRTWYVYRKSVGIVEGGGGDIISFERRTDCLIVSEVDRIGPT